MTGADYGAVRVGAFMGYRVLADLAGLPVTPGDRPRHVRVEDPRWHGYLANVTPDVFAGFEQRIPVTLAGDAFLARYGGTTDPVTDVDSATNYAVRTPTAHPVYEHRRVTRVGASTGPPEADAAPVLGELMYQSHASYSACGLGSDGTDLLVQLAREAGRRRASSARRSPAGAAAALSPSSVDATPVRALRRSRETTKHAPVAPRTSSKAVRPALPPSAQCESMAHPA